MIWGSAAAEESTGLMLLATMGTSSVGAMLSTMNTAAVTTRPMARASTVSATASATRTSRCDRNPAVFISTNSTTASSTRMVSIRVGAVCVPVHQALRTVPPAGWDPRSGRRRGC